MEIDGFEEIMHIICVAKKLYDSGRYDIAAKSLSNDLDYDNYYYGMYELMENIFEYSDYKHFEHRNLELHVLSDPVIVDFYVMAGNYGKLNGFSDIENPYIKEAEAELGRRLNISHCMDWMLMCHTEPKRPYHSRIGLIISNDCGCTDFGVIAYKLIEIYEWFKRQCEELSAKLSTLKPSAGKPTSENLTFNERQEIAA